MYIPEHAARLAEPAVSSSQEELKLISSMIDLALARSYYPVCYAFLLTTCVCASVAVFSSMQIPAFNTFVIAAALLFMDNIKRKEVVFDANNLASFVLFSLVFNEERHAHVPADAGQRPVAIACNVIWLVFASLALLRCEERAPFCKYLSPNHTAVGALMLTVHSFLYHEREPEPIVVLSAVTFIAFSVMWMYVIHVQELSAKSVFDCVPCMIYFGPLLVMQPACRVLFSVWTCVVLFMMYHHQHSAARTYDTESHLLVKRSRLSHTAEHGSDSEAAEDNTNTSSQSPRVSQSKASARRKTGAVIDRAPVEVAAADTSAAEDHPALTHEARFTIDDGAGGVDDPAGQAEDFLETQRMFEEALRQQQQPGGFAPSSISNISSKNYV